MKLVSLVLALALAGGAQGTHAASGTAAPVKVRYIVKDVAAATSFYTRDLGFHLDAQSGRNFAMLSRGGLQLILSPPVGPGGASQPMPNGVRAQPGGWDRIILESKDLRGDVARLRKAGVHFRNTIVSGPGGSQILLDDPSGNAVELFQPA
ncbi:MAG TPA: VOC family protein [Caulobacteraceae bacterium]|jgi:catechol 2,3-dioxygenase-like lactoylglutathione lyase family enzyme|nr:VOC family protein [Caulobacteraceae bacterium]